MRCCHRQRRLGPEARRLEGQRPLQQPHPREQQGLGPAWRTKEVFKDGAAMTGQERKKRRGFDWRTLNEKRLNQPEQAYLYKTCVKQSTQETTSAWEFLSLNPRPKDLGRLYEMAPERIFLVLHFWNDIVSCRHRPANEFWTELERFKRKSKEDLGSKEPMFAYFDVMVRTCSIRIFDFVPRLAAIEFFVRLLFIVID